jgi:electron transport complex protein RnfB
MTGQEAIPGPAFMPGLAVMPGPAAVVVTVACQGCGACLLTCPEQAIRPVPDRGSSAPLTVLPGRCSGCGECVEICPADAIFLAEEAMTW